MDHHQNASTGYPRTFEAEHVLTAMTTAATIWLRVSQMVGELIIEEWSRTLHLGRPPTP